MMKFSFLKAVQVFALTGWLLMGAFGLQKMMPEQAIMLNRLIRSCLPWDVFYWKKPDQAIELKRYDIVMFPAKNMKPYFQDGSIIIKMVAGLPGDKVSIREGNVYINGIYIDDVRDGSFSLKKPMNFWDKEYVLGPDEIFVFGSEPRSFDSRYWGPYPKHLVRGHAVVLF